MLSSNTDVQIILHTNDILQIASSKMRTRSMMKGNSVLNILNNKIGVKTNGGGEERQMLPAAPELQS